MVIRSKTPFQLSFFQKREFPVEHFYHDINNIHSIGATLVENIEFSLQFRSTEPSSRLYMDGLDLLSDEEVLTDSQGNLYLTPKNKKVILFKNFTTHLPWIPGIYRIKIHSNQETLYTLLKINPKQLTFTQWEQMIKEIEDEWKGLTQELIKNQWRLPSLNSRSTSIELLSQFSIIKGKFPFVLSALREVTQNGRNIVSKSYRLVDSYQLKKIDNKSIRFHLSNPHKSKWLAPVYKIDKDLPENQWVKRIIFDLLERLKMILQAFEEYLLILQKENHDLYPYHYQTNTQKKIEQNNEMLYQIQTKIDQIKQMKKSLSWFTQLEWFKHISPISQTTIPASLVIDSRYRSLFQLHRLLNSDLPIQMNQSFSLNWKRTDLLYEVWGFTMLYKTLIKLGFQHCLVSEQKIEMNIFSNLPSGTSISFLKKPLHAVLTYDEEIPTEPNQSNCPLYSIGTSNRPDIRLDFYYHHDYIGSMIFECKYRPLHRIWNLQKHHQIKKQLLQYAYLTKSNNMFQHQISPFIRKQIRPVYQVWALYPVSIQTSDGSDNVIQIDEQIKLIQVSPGRKNDQFVSSLQFIINMIFSEYENWGTKNNSCH